MNTISRLTARLWVRTRVIEAYNGAHSPAQQLALWKKNPLYRVAVTLWAILYNFCAAMGIDA